MSTTLNLPDVADQVAAGRATVEDLFFLGWSYTGVDISDPEPIFVHLLPWQQVKVTRMVARRAERQSQQDTKVKGLRAQHRVHMAALTARGTALLDDADLSDAEYDLLHA